MVKKGVTKATHIKAGLKVKKAGMQLSEYVMPGLGGKKLSEEHALETADALNRIDPEFIRLRSLAIPNMVPLFNEWESGGFEKCTDVETAKEILIFIEALNGISSEIKSDHILNLFEEIEGKLPQDKEKMINVLQTFLAMEPKKQVLFQVGRRLGLFRRLSDMDSSRRLARVEQVCKENAITPKNVDSVIDEMMKRFI
jgi:radical SAM superfamily enzyme